MEKTRVGVVGCGNISGIYFRNCAKMENLEVVACADLVREKARAAAEEYDVPKVCSTEDLLADPDVEIVLNLTIPNAHAEVALAAVEAGKHVYNEKPLAVDREDGRRVLEAARENGLRVGGAPDTFMGAGGQTCRQLIDRGAIGEPIGAVAFLTCRGHETWHPDPEFYYKPGGGPMFDMGPYYLTALINLIGPVDRVTGSTGISFPERTITSEPKHGQKIEVEVPTHVNGLLDFANGAIATVLTSFDVWAASLPRIQIYGEEGSLTVPDPNGFGGTPRLWQPEKGEWTDVPLERPYAENSRGLGLADMAAAIQNDRPHRAGGELTFHVLDIMEAIHDASDEGRHVELESQCARPAALPADLQEGRIDA
jgi:predicted dehydrogenase